MYTKQDLTDLDKQIKSRVLLWLIPEIILLALVALAFAHRIEWLTALLFSAFLFVLIFSLNLMILPVRRYRSWVALAQNGRTSQGQGYFKLVEPETIKLDGVQFRRVILSQPDPRADTDERQYYFDANLPLPEWQEGDHLLITSHEKQMVRWERLPAAATTTA